MHALPAEQRGHDLLAGCQTQRRPPPPVVTSTPRRSSTISCRSSSSFSPGFSATSCSNALPLRRPVRLAGRGCCVACAFGSVPLRRVRLLPRCGKFAYGGGAVRRAADCMATECLRRVAQARSRSSRKHNAAQAVRGAHNAPSLRGTAVLWFHPATRSNCVACSTDHPTIPLSRRFPVGWSRVRGQSVQPGRRRRSARVWGPVCWVVELLFATHRTSVAYIAHLQRGRAQRALCQWHAVEQWLCSSHPGRPTGPQSP